MTHARCCCHLYGMYKSYHCSSRYGLQCFLSHFYPWWRSHINADICCTLSSKFVCKNEKIAYVREKNCFSFCRGVFPYPYWGFMLVLSWTCVCVLTKGKKVHTLDIAPLHSETPLQKRSGMARVLKGSHSFTCTPTRSSTIGMSHTCLCLPSRNWYSFTDPGGMKAE